MSSNTEWLEAIIYTNLVSPAIRRKVVLRAYEKIRALERQSWLDTV